MAMALLVIPDLMMAFSPGLEALLFWRFVQGLLLPPIFAVSIAYIGGEWPAGEATGVTGLFIAATAVGGFTGRMLIAALAEPIGWRHAFFACAAITAICAVAVLLRCAAREEFRARRRRLRPRFADVPPSARNAAACDLCGRLRHHVQFHRRLHLYRIRAGGAAFLLSATAIGLVFVVYLSSLFTTPYTGRLVARFGRRNFGLMAIAAWICGILLTLVPPCRPSSAG